MVICVGLLRSALVAVVLVALAGSGSAAEKLAECCTSVSTEEIKDPILGYLIQRKNLPCVQAVIFQTEKGLFCRYGKAPWVSAKIAKFRASKNASSPPRPSSASPTSRSTLLSLITSSSSPPSSSPPSSFFSTSRKPIASQRADQ